MKKNLIFFATVIFLTACSGGGEKNETKMVMSDLAIDNLKGDISSIEETPYQTDSLGKAAAMDSCCISVSEYDANGNGIKYTSKDSKGTVKDENTFARYENGMWKGSKNRRDGKPSGSMETTQDEKGQYTTATEFDSAGKMIHYYTGITQNENGQILSWKQYDKDSVFHLEGAIVYEKNLQTGFMLKDSVGKVKSTSNMKYNDKGEQTEVTNTEITKDSTKTTVTKYTYDAHDEMGNWTQRTTWDDKGKATGITKRTYTYRKK